MSTQIATLPDAPAATDPVDDFDAKAFAFNAALATFRTQANAMALEMQVNADVAAALILAMALPQFAGTSTSSVTVGTGTRTFVTQSGKGWIVGQIVVASSGANYVKGTVTDYTGTDLELNVTSINGSGTYAAWDIGLSYDGLALAASGVNGDITELHGLLVALSKSQGGTGSKTGAVLRGHIDGFRLSPAGGSATMHVGSGEASDSTNSDLIVLASALSKTTSAWAAGSGSGGLDTGSIANGTWYYFYVIRRPDTGVVDVVFSINSTSPALPTNYTQYRYIGAGLTNGSGQWVAYTQVGDDFFWSSPVNDFNGAGPTAATLLTCSLPRGRKVKGDFSVTGNQSGGVDITVYVSDPANADMAPAQSNGVAVVSTAASGTSGYQTSKAAVWTNTSGQVRLRASSTQAVRITTFGWTDLRGKDL